MPLATNQLLKYNGSKWSNDFAKVSELSDVTLTSVATGDVIKYNGTNWINGTVSGGGGGISFVSTWNARTNTPTITSGSGTAGQYYRVSVSGTTTIDGISNWRYGDWIVYNGTTWDRIIVASDKNNTFLPDVFYSNYNFEAVKRYIEDISVSGRYTPVIVRGYTVTAQSGQVGAITSVHTNNILCVPVGTNGVVINPLTNTITTVTNILNYYDVGYHPLLERYYLAVAHTSSTWHYYDKIDAFTSYTGVALTSGAYFGIVWSPTQSRLYFVPYTSPGTSWHYIDSTGTVTAYTHGATIASGAYYGGVYSPSQNRIYFVPYNQVVETQWHYIDCATGNVVAYTHGVTVGGSYLGGVYSPTQNRIYFVPYGQANQTQWHYIDCNTGTVVAYTHGITAVNAAYIGGTYSPTQNRLYLVPNVQASQTQWHYIDCNTGSVVAYTHGVTAVSGAYRGGAYSPSTDRIIFSPYNQAAQTTWHYIDCKTGSKVPQYFSTAIVR